MTDLALQALDDGTYDLVLWGGDLLADDSLRPAVIASLLTDREYADAADGDRRGSWQDALLADAADRNGSLLWRVLPGKRTPAKLAEAKQYAEQALAWLVDDSIASGVSVTPSWDARGQLQLDVEIARANGVERYRLAELWQKSLGPSAIDEASDYALVMSGIAGDYQYIWYTALPELAE
ncbi:phage GP46 family protein [Solimonas flava]|uniref:phage GP46 family protein n=1 Tax=Solimonas flava TaxID=415849 RepID=UPI0003FCAD60|nr:phage GP46 family protein [Solimonas flava]